jgi:LuxR family maltose regulon positive regulatory protein
MAESEWRHVSIPDDLLHTKLALPRPPAKLVARPALVARLEDGATRRLTLLVAPAGFGKTTLVTQWVAAQSRAVAWITLDAGDNDPVRFWRYLFNACRTFDPAPGRLALATLRTAQQPPLESLLTPFINELAGLPGDYALVLDDFHTITAREVNQTLGFLLDYCPANLHLMLLTRSEPALPLARLRAQDELVELNAADLRFSLPETAAFLEQTIPTALPPDMAAHLEQRTEGWVAGLRLVALALQNKPDPQAAEQFLRTFTGRHRHVLEYLVSEVLDSQTEPVQRFLLHTSFLSRLTGALCDSVTGRSDSALILEQLEQRNLFLISLGSSEGHSWYRYYTLFAEAMRHYASQRLSDSDIQTLHEKASRWYEWHGLLNDAVEEAIAAQDSARAASLIAQIFDRRSFNELYTMRRWLELLPDAILQQHPLLCYVNANALLFTGDRYAPSTGALVEKWLQRAEEVWRREANDPRLGQILTMRSMLALWQQGDMARAVASAHQSLEYLAEDDVLNRGTSLLVIGIAELLAGKANSAQRLIMESSALFEAARSIQGSLASMGLLADVCFQQGELDQAAYYYQQVVEQAVGSEDMLDDQSSAAFGLSRIAYERNDLDSAEQQAARAFELGQYRHEERQQVHAALVLARVQHARGRTLQAQQRLQALTTTIHLPVLLREVKTALAHLARASGDLEGVQSWLEGIAAQADDALPSQQEEEVLLAARIYLDRGDPQKALDVLEGWRKDAHAEGRLRSEIGILCLMALAAFAQQDAGRAEQWLTRALTLGQPRGFQRTFLDEGQAMAALLKAIGPNLNKRVLTAYAATLLRAFSSGRNPGRNGEAAALPEPLSQQEQRVLRLIAAGLSNPEIAHELIVSTNTIKTHVKNIYRKLNVNTREEVQDAARELNLL